MFSYIAKSFLALFSPRTACYAILCPFLYFNSLSSYQYKLTVGAIFRDEAPYLKEWIEYHRLVGVEHFYLFNDQSSDNYKEVLAPYIANGIVDLADAIAGKNINARQTDCYNRTVKKALRKSKWVAMIDIDEFLVTPIGISVLDVLKKLQSYGGVSISWRTFGTSGLNKIPPNTLLIECLTHCASNKSRWNQKVKTICRPERVRKFTGPHVPIYLPGWYSVNTDGRCYKSGAPLTKHSKLWINHYWTRDEGFFFNVKIPRSSQYGRADQYMMDQLPVLNEMTDDSILRHVPELKKIMFDAV